MKKTLLLIFSALLAFNVAYPQAKKPTIMVVPSDNWCIKHGYTLTFDDQGSELVIPDYKKAFQQSSDLLLVVSKLNELMAERGFPLKNMESAIKTLQANAAEDNMRTSKTGSEQNESPTDRLLKVAKCDIIMQVTWTVVTQGPKKSIEFNIQGLDAYTDKQVAGASGTGSPSFSASLGVLLEEAVLSHLDNFNGQLQTHFEDLFANGREVIIRIKTWGDWDEDLETEYGPDDEELGTIIEDWMYANTEQHRFRTTDATESMMLFEQVRIPMMNEKGRASDARDFVKGLSKFLKNEPYNIPNKRVAKGLGRATLWLGGK